MGMFQPPNPAAYFDIVWDIVEQIPEGRVSTYGQIASMIPPPDGIDPEQYERLSPRWVGTAMNASKDREIPWQRVINGQGKISFPQGSPNGDAQRGMLEMEGVKFDEQDRVDFEIVAWDGPDEDWLRAHNLMRPKSLMKKKSGSRKSSSDESSQPSLF
jgi:methylated-DNA-protein-cysteine methyltransferase related protein